MKFFSPILALAAATVLLLLHADLVLGGCCRYVNKVCVEEAPHVSSSCGGELDTQVGVVEAVSPNGLYFHDTYWFDTLPTITPEELFLKIESHALNCITFQPIDGGEGEQFYVMTVTWNMIVEVDKFEVTTCDQDHLERMIKFIESDSETFGPSDKRLFRYTGSILFKYSGRCWVRRYEVEIFELYITVDRSEVSEAPDCRDLEVADGSQDIDISQDIVTSGKLKGKWRETNFLWENFVRTIELPATETNPCGNNCWMVVQTHDTKELTIKVVDIIVDNQYLDRFKVNSVEEGPISASFKFIGKHTESDLLTISIMYMNSGGGCYVRKYTQKTTQISPKESQTVIGILEDKPTECLPDMTKSINSWVKRNVEKRR